MKLAFMNIKIYTIWYDFYKNIKELKCAFNSPMYDFSFLFKLQLNICDRD